MHAPVEVQPTCMLLGRMGQRSDRCGGKMLKTALTKWRVREHGRASTAACSKALRCGREFSIRLISTWQSFHSDEARPVLCPVDVRTLVCESSQSGRRSASYDASTKEQNPKEAPAAAPLGTCSPQKGDPVQ